MLYVLMKVEISVWCVQMMTLHAAKWGSIDRGMRRLGSVGIDKRRILCNHLKLLLIFYASKTVRARVWKAHAAHIVTYCSSWVTVCYAGGILVADAADAADA